MNSIERHLFTNHYLINLNKFSTTSLIFYLKVSLDRAYHDLFFFVESDPLGVTLRGHPKKNNYLTNLDNFSTIDQIFDLKMSLVRAYQDLKLCVWT